MAGLNWWDWLPGSWNILTEQKAPESLSCVPGELPPYSPSLLQCPKSPTEAEKDHEDSDPTFSIPASLGTETWVPGAWQFFL